MRQVRIICERDFENDDGRVHLSVCSDKRAVLSAYGRGTVFGAKKLVELLDAMHEELGRDTVVTALVDVRHIRGAPVRGQAIILKKMFSDRHRVERCAVVGVGPLEIKIARTALKVTGMQSRVHLCDEVPDALRWLDWPAHRFTPLTPPERFRVQR